KKMLTGESSLHNKGRYRKLGMQIPGGHKFLLTPGFNLFRQKEADPVAAVLIFCPAAVSTFF
ncbi:MAG: hypothetical protein ABUT20_44600, partial [Bacteroidota bacterium]